MEGGKPIPPSNRRQQTGKFKFVWWKGYHHHSLIMYNCNLEIYLNLSTVRVESVSNRSEFQF